MSRFKKVSETQKIPNSIQRALFASVDIDDENQFADLEASAMSRRSSMARETHGYNGNNYVKPENDWESVKSARKLNRQKFVAYDDEMSNLSPEDISNRSIRRVSSRDENDFSYGFKNNPYRTGGADDIYTRAYKPVSVYGDDMEIINDALLQIAKLDDNRFKNTSAMLHEQRNNKHDEWEKKQNNSQESLRETIFSPARAHKILKAANESSNHNNGFGVQNMKYIDQKEKLRMAMRENKRAQKLAIKHVDYMTHEEKHDEWQREKYNMYARRPGTYLDENDPNWLDKHLDSLV